MLWKYMAVSSQMGSLLFFVKEARLIQRKWSPKTKAWPLFRASSWSCSLSESPPQSVPTSVPSHWTPTYPPVFSVSTIGICLSFVLSPSSHLLPLSPHRLCEAHSLRNDSTLWEDPQLFSESRLFIEHVLWASRSANHFVLHFKKDITFYLFSCGCVNL